ncbi:MAG: hypothetical protein R3C61_11980 [Bacteroidia bacterium]
MKYFEEYIRITRKTLKRDFLRTFSIHYAGLSRIINDKEEPGVELAYRLEKHSGNLIKAVVWWELMMKKQSFVITQDEQTRKLEQSKVKNYPKAG